jgi:hypothetical protein
MGLVALPTEICKKWPLALDGKALAAIFLIVVDNGWRRCFTA